MAPIVEVEAIDVDDKSDYWLRSIGQKKWAVLLEPPAGPSRGPGSCKQNHRGELLTCQGQTGGHAPRASLRSDRVRRRHEEIMTYPQSRADTGPVARQSSRLRYHSPFTRQPRQRPLCPANHPASVPLRGGEPVARAALTPCADCFLHQCPEGLGVGLFEGSEIAGPAAESLHASVSQILATRCITWPQWWIGLSPRGSVPEQST